MGIENACACETSLWDGDVTLESRIEAVELRRALAKREVGVGGLMGRKDVPRAQRGARSAVARYCDASLITPRRVRTALFRGRVAFVLADA
jgi:hypothetical protein